MQEQMDVQEQMDMALQADEIKRHKANRISIQGKEYTLRPITNKIDAIIAGYAFDALRWERELHAENCSARRMKKLNYKIRQIPAKIAAYYKLGKLSHFIPGLWSYTWRKLFNKSEEISATINSVGATGENKDFFSANLEVLKYLLALSMRQVGESVKQKLEREESATAMLDKDASPKREVDNKLDAHSKKVKSTKK